MSMSSELSANYNFGEIEKKWKAYWQQNNIYAWNANISKEDTFIVDTPPPTVSGQLHIGHVYSYTQADFIVRFKRMCGKNIFYPIGFDDNGLPTERLVEKQRKIKATQISREEFIKICKEVVEVEEEKFRDLFKSIALSVDWNLEYQTISNRSRSISQMSFLDLVEKKQVYRGMQPILWDPVDQTALAQAEVEDKEKEATMNDIVFLSEDNEQLVIATTRPEMLPACVAIFYNSDDERYKHLEGKYAYTPLFNKKVPIYADDLVKQDKGSGLVMCCTFGDSTDIKWWQKHNLPLISLINKYGKISEIDITVDCADADNAQKYFSQIIGLKVSDAREKIIEILNSNNLLLKQEKIIHSVKCAERSGALIEILTTSQWFVKTIEHKEALLKRSNELNWYPKSMKIKLDNWIEGTSWDWCISRQRYFGVPFPVWYSKKVGEEGKIIYANKEDLPVDPMVDLPKGYSRDEVEADLDVMDTWATSSVSPQLSSHGISEKYTIDSNRHKKLFPADLRPQAHEILRTWAYYTILKAHLHQDSLPWKNIMISGWCLATDKSKMSKSKGNVIVPQDLLNTYGADILRYWAATAKLGADIVYSEDVMKNGKRLVNKLWNASKFVSIHFDKILKEDLSCDFNDIKMKITHPIDKWLINELVSLEHQVFNKMQDYKYSGSLHIIEQFFWSMFCDDYLEITKKRAYNEDAKDNEGQYSVILTLYHTLRIILQLLAPIMPYITEEIFSIYRNNNALGSIHKQSSWCNIDTWVFVEDKIQQDKEEIENLRTILKMVRISKASNNLSVKASIQKLEIKGAKINHVLQTELQNVASIQSIDYVQEFGSQIGQVISEDLFQLNIIY